MRSLVAAAACQAAGTPAALAFARNPDGTVRIKARSTSVLPRGNITLNVAANRGGLHRSVKAGLMVLLSVAVLPAPAHAADEDTQIWTALSASADLGTGAVITLEGQTRLTDGANRLGQYLIRPSIGLKLDQTTTVSIGYAFVHTDPLGPSRSNEHRIWQQLAFRVAGDGKGVTLTGRSRLEQRWLEGAGDMGWRFRQQFRMTGPLAGKVRAVVGTEVFISLDDTSWGQTKGLDRWRNSVGIAVPLNPAITVEPGYINQWVMRRGPDRVHHIANVSLSAKF